MEYLHAKISKFYRWFIILIIEKNKKKIGSPRIYKDKEETS